MWSQSSAAGGTGSWTCLWRRRCSFWSGGKKCYHSNIFPLSTLGPFLWADWSSPNSNY
jgi:hypothetical protein